MSKGSHARQFNKENNEKLRNNKFWENCEHEKKKRKARS